MIEILWHGRGGQGAFTAARLLGAAWCAREGRHALAFPSFGPERRGAPMRAYTKLADAPIGDRSASTVADVVVYLDETLLAPGFERELKPRGTVLVNSASAFADPRIRSIDANGISAELLGRPIPNTALLGALTTLGLDLTAADVEQAIRALMPSRLHDKNIAVVERAAQVFSGAADESGDVVVGAQDGAAVEAFSAPAGSSWPAIDIPHLRDTLPEPADYAGTTTYEAGYLVAKNAGWRLVRPVIDAQACTGCLQCYMACPDGTIRKAPESEETGAAVFVDLDWCKGCGICAKACRVGAIAMLPEGGE